MSRKSRLGPRLRPLPRPPALAYMSAMTATRPDSQEMGLAWNGLSLTVPETWRAARLGLRHVFLEDDQGPVFEWKWRPGAGRDGMEAALRALTPRHQARSGGELPGAWLTALADYELMPLSWSREGRSGLGAALFDPATGTAAVFQAYGGPEGPDQDRLDRTAAVLRSLRLDRPGYPAFRIYGLRFTPPPEFFLASFEFLPGRFSLSFAASRRRLDVVRLAPADVLLGRDDLAAQAVRAFGFETGARHAPGQVAGAPAVWLASRQGGRGWDAVLRVLGRPGRLAVLRHEAASNKLLGAALTANRPVDRDWLADVAAGCVSL